MFILITEIQKDRYNKKYPDYEYTLFCTIDGYEYEMDKIFIAKTDEEALEKIKNSIWYESCEKPRIKKNGIKNND